MRIAIVGAGGTGGYFGGLLAHAGRDVTFIARGATLEALRTRGLTVKLSEDDAFTVAVAATDDPATVGPVDVILICVKAYDSADAARSIRPMVGPGTVVISVQNGVDNEQRIAEIVGEHAVMGAIATLSARTEAPGVIVVTDQIGGITFGERAGGDSARAAAVREALEGAGFGVAADPNITGQLWHKFVFICALSGVTALARQPIGTILRYPESAALYRGVMEETAAVARAAGVALPDRSVETWMERSASVNPAMFGSMYFDLLHGRRMELRWLNGTVVRLGQEHGVATPLNLAIYGALRPYEDGAAKE